MIHFPPCKVNLGLKILYKRSDGFHELETAFYPVPLCDALEVVKAEPSAEKVLLEIAGMPVSGDISQNLITRAYALLDKQFDLPPVKFFLLKNIPMGAGLGGGSSDGASALLLLNRRFDLNLGPSELEGYAAELGSDCAFFIQSMPMIGTGRGEILRPISLSLEGNWMALVKPPLSISTAEAYSGCMPTGIDHAGQLEEILKGDRKAWRETLTNDFEKHLFARYPVLDEIKNKLYSRGAWYASMSGSGSTLFALFDHKPDLQDEFENCFYWECLMPELIRPV